MNKDIKIEIFSTDDEKDVMALLREAELPTGDLTGEKLKNFLVARNDDGSVIGAVGVEQYDDTGLLRSLVVHPSCRGKGLGRELTFRLETLARQKGIKMLFLLTMTAQEFFPKVGYEIIKRENVPCAIGSTEEFRNICPVSAVCLGKAL